MNHMWVQSYEKQAAVHHDTTFRSGGLTYYERDNYYEDHYPGICDRAHVITACCHIVRQAVRQMPNDIDQHRALSLFTWENLRDALPQAGIMPKDIPEDIWLKAIVNELVQIFLATRKDFRFNDDPQPTEYLGEDSHGNRLAIINGEVAAPSFMHKDIQVWMAIYPISTYPRLTPAPQYRQYSNGMVWKQRYFGCVGETVVDDSTKAGVKKGINAALRGEPWRQ